MTGEDAHLRRTNSAEDRLAEILLREMREFRSEVGKRLDRLVTQEAFQAEKERVNERMGDMREDLVAERQARERAVQEEAEARVAALASEKEARSRALQAEQEKRVAVEMEQERARNKNRWFIGVALVPLAFMLMQYVFDALAASQGGG